MPTLSDELVFQTQQIHNATPQELRKLIESRLDDLLEKDPDGEFSKTVLETYFEGDFETFRRAWEDNEDIQVLGMPLEVAVAGEVAKTAAVLRHVAFEQYALEAKMDTGEVFAMHCTAGNIWQQECYLLELMNKLIDIWGVDKAGEFLDRFVDDEITPPENRYQVILEALNQLS